MWAVFCSCPKIIFIIFSLTKDTWVWFSLAQDKISNFLCKNAFLHTNKSHSVCKGGHGTVFILIAAHAPISANPSYFEGINHKIINQLHRSIHEANILSSTWLEISLKMTKSYTFGLIFVSNIETNKCPPEMTYLSALGAFWNEYGNWHLRVLFLFVCLFVCLFFVFSSIS